MHVALLGVEVDDEAPAALPFDPPVIGYLSKMTESLGLGRLVDAFIALKQKPGLSTLKLRATGGQLGADRNYVSYLKKKLHKHGMEDDAEFLEGFDAAERRRFFHSLSVLSVPAIYGESFGLFITESLAAGVPVVQPRVGGFPEVVEATGGGVLYNPDTPNALVESLESILRDPERAKALGQTGREAVANQFGVDRMAADVAAVYESLA